LTGSVRKRARALAARAALATLLLAPADVAALQLQSGLPSPPPGRLLVDGTAAKLSREVYLSSEIRHEWVVSNPTAETISVTSTRNPQGVGSIAVEPERIPPGGSARLVVRQPAIKLGAFNFRYSFVTDEPAAPRYRVSITGFAQSAYDPEQLSFPFGMIENATATTIRRELGSREVDRLELLESRGLPEFLALEVERSGIAGEGLALALRTIPPVPLGFHAGEFELHTGVPNQPWFRAAYGLHAFGDIVPMQSPVEIGSLTPGAELVGATRLTSRSGTEFNVAAVSSASETAHVEAKRCPDIPACWEVTVRARPAIDARQRVAGDIAVRIEGQDEIVPLRFQGLYFPAGTAIRDLEIETPDPGAPIVPESTP